MASVVISGDTSGSVTLSAPSVAGTTTLTLPTTSSTLATLAAQTFTGTQTMTTLTSPASTALTLQSAGTTAITVDTSQNVGIGTTSPSSASGTSLAIYNASGQARLAFKNGVTGNASTDGFQVGIDGDGIALVEQRENLAMVFSTNATERMRINATAPVLCLAGGSTTATGTGIAFPATQSASSDANTLDDYEEGTWTPTGNGVSYTSNTGKYTKIGDFVFCSYALTFPSTASTSGAQIQGLPFTIGSQPRGTATVSETDCGVNPIMMALSGTTAFIRDASNNDRLNASFSSKFLNGMIIYRV